MASEPSVLLTPTMLLLRQLLLPLLRKTRCAVLLADPTPAAVLAAQLPGLVLLARKLLPVGPRILPAALAARRAAAVLVVDVVTVQGPTLLRLTADPDLVMVYSQPAAA